MSLRWRIMGFIVFVIVLTVLTSAGVGYYATQSRLGVFVDEIGNEQASRLARNLSREYTSAGGWETVDRPLSEAGYIYDEIPQREGHEEDEGESWELFHRDPVRVVITGANGVVVIDNLSRLQPGAGAPDLEGRREVVLDLNTDQPVGHVLRGREPRVPLNRGPRVSEHPPVHRGHRRILDSRSRRTDCRLAVQPDHCPCYGPDGSNPGNRPRRHYPVANHIPG